MPVKKLRLATSVPPEFLEVLGAITVNFQAVQNTLSLSIWMLLGGMSAEADEKFQIVTAQMSAKNLAWTFTSLYRQQFPGKNEKPLQELQSRVFAAEQKRNTLTHSLWLEGNGEAALRLKIIARGEYKLAAEEHTKEQLTEVANELAALSYDITKFTLTAYFAANVETDSET
jgi:hypothetical protein